MGEARRRGTFEERKAQAIKAGRIKKEGTNWKKPSPFLPRMGTAFPGELLETLIGMSGIPRIANKLLDEKSTILTEGVQEKE